MKLIIISTLGSFIEHCQEIFSSSDNVTCVKGDIRSLPRENMAFVSPANSLGFMDGGIDFILSREMFPGCEKDVKAKIAALGKKTLLGRPYLRIGSAIWTYVNDTKSALISAPTMFLPHPILHTQNVYWAMQAALRAFEKIQAETVGRIDTLVITSMGCGVGCLDPESAAFQIRNAWREYETGTLPLEVEDHGIHVALLPSHDDAQPSNYDNREIGVAWPPGWAPVVASPGPVRHISITPSQNRGNSVCYDA